MTWYVIVEGQVGDQLWPDGLMILDTYTNPEECARDARLLSSLEGKAYRVLTIQESVFIRAPVLQVLPGGGSNPLSPIELADMRRGIKKYLAELREKAAKEKEKL